LATFHVHLPVGYGSPEVDATTPKITKAEGGADGKSVRLFVDGLQEGQHSTT